MQPQGTAKKRGESIVMMMPTGGGKRSAIADVDEVYDGDTPLVSPRHSKSSESSMCIDIDADEGAMGADVTTCVQASAIADGAISPKHRQIVLCVQEGNPTAAATDALEGEAEREPDGHSSLST